MPAAVAIAIAAGRWLGGVLVLLVLSAIAVFSLELLVPGDPALTLLTGEVGRIPSEAEVAAKRQELGPDSPFLPRMLGWLGDLAHLDLGRSSATPSDVIDLIAPRVGATLLLGVMALVIALVLSLALGVLAPPCAGHAAWTAACASPVSLFAAVPGLRSRRPGAPVRRHRPGHRHASSPTASPGRGAPARDGARGPRSPAAWARPVRGIALDVIASDVVRVARARGVPPVG